jgi:hypothetical protein
VGRRLDRSGEAAVVIEGYFPHRPHTRSFRAGARSSKPAALGPVDLHHGLPRLIERTNTYATWRDSVSLR